jgi:hypothetical protein
MSTAIPSNLNLGLTKPTTVPAYCRRVESIATNAQTFAENSTANIVLDTSTPGSFLDPQQSLLQFDIELRNENPYIDYVNLSASGMAAVIQDMRIICQGTPIEEMFDYNLMFEMFMDLGGHMQEEFKMYMENGWRAPVCPGEPDLNFVKPPMIDREGIIMNPNAINLFGDANAANTHWEEGNQTIDRGDTSYARRLYDISATSGDWPNAFLSWPNPTLGFNYAEAGKLGNKNEGPREMRVGVLVDNLVPSSETVCFCTAIENNSAGTALELTVSSITGFSNNDFLVLTNLDPLVKQVAPKEIDDCFIYRVIAAPAGSKLTVQQLVQMNTDATGKYTGYKLRKTALNNAPDVLGLNVDTFHFFSQGKRATDTTTVGGATTIPRGLPQLFSGATVVRLQYMPDKQGFYKDDTHNNVGNYIHLTELDHSKYFGTNAPGNIRTACWTNRIDNTYVTWPQTLRPEPLWKNESRMRMEGDTKKYRVQDYLQFLANVKNIPVGISSPKSIINSDEALRHDVSESNRGETDVSKWNFTEFRNYFTSNPNHLTNAFQSFKCTVTLPIFSGILGVWAEKQFPSMLVSPGSFYLQIKFASAQNAFQCAMDPCRRIHGTYRDYVPNCGLPNYYQTEFAGQNVDRTKCRPSQKAVSTTNGVTTHHNTSMAITPAGARGHDFAWNGIQTNEATNTFSFFRKNLLGQGFMDGTINRGGIKRVNTTFASNGDETYNDIENVDFILLNSHLGQGEGNTTGNAKPQYVPRRTPWKCLADYWGFGPNTCKTKLTELVTIGSDYGYVRERDVCFGTYLPASTAQVRRTRIAFNNCPGIAGFNGDKPVTYQITNLKYVGIQTILPDEVTASIVRQAASSDISLHAQSCRTYKSLLSQSLTQNLILPVKVASANSMWVLFQNQKMLDNTHYCSLTRTCPFSAFQWTPSSTGCAVGSNVIPNVKSVTSQNAFQIQLRIGNELLPIQPMTCVQHVVTELMRSVHGLGDMNTELPLSAFVRNKTFNDNKSEKPNENIYNSLKSGDFLVPYIPIEALDDQTITNNPIFMDYHNAQNTGFQSFYGSDKQFNDRDRYVLPEFLPPISKFLLGFDLDTFPGTNNVARSGRYLGNAPLTLQMTNVHAAALPSISNVTQADSISATVIVLHDIRFSIMAGGQILAYY